MLLGPFHQPLVVHDTNETQTHVKRYQKQQIHIKITGKIQRHETADQQHVGNLNFGQNLQIWGEKCQNFSNFESGDGAHQPLKRKRIPYGHRGQRETLRQRRIIIQIERVHGEHGQALQQKQVPAQRPRNFSKTDDEIATGRGRFRFLVSRLPQMVGEYGVEGEKRAREAAHVQETVFHIDEVAADDGAHDVPQGGETAQFSETFDVVVLVLVFLDIIFTK